MRDADVQAIATDGEGFRFSGSTLVLGLTIAFALVSRFLSMLEEEVYSQNSPIWDQDFLSASSRTSQLGIQTGKFLFASIREQPSSVTCSSLCIYLCFSSRN